MIYCILHTNGLGGIPWFSHHVHRRTNRDCLCPLYKFKMLTDFILKQIMDIYLTEESAAIENGHVSIIFENCTGKKRL